MVAEFRNTLLLRLANDEKKCYIPIWEYFAEVSANFVNRVDDKVSILDHYDNNS